MKLFTTEFGSKLYGTQTPTSDTDLKHIVLPSLNSLLIGKKIENKVKKTNTEKNTRNGVDDIDEEEIPAQIFARHFIEGQTYAIELAFALDGTHANQTVYDPRGDVSLFTKGHGKSATTELLVTINDDSLAGGHYAKPLFVEFVRELRTQFLTSNIKAMMGYVVNQASLYSFKGERLNATRELLEFFEEFENTKYPELETKLEVVEADNREFFWYLNEKYPKYFREDTYDVGGQVLRPCFVILEKTLPFSNTVGQTLKVLRALTSKYGSRADQASESNVDWKATMHAMRIVDEGLELLENHTLTFPFKKDYVDHLLAIKRGELPLDPIKEELSAKLDRLKGLEKSTTLPAIDPEFMKKFDMWLTAWMRRFYDIV